MDISYRAREANRIIYDKLADRYEAVDGRRSPDLCLWARKRLEEAADIVGKKGILLDIGCGTGFIGRAAKEMFSDIYGIDISENILKVLSGGVSPIRGDAGELPFKDKTIDAAVLFSVIHHFYDYRPVLAEAYRALRPSGVIYIDHDMNKYFFNNFRFSINIYRKLFRKERILNKMKIQKELYRLSEFHSEGIDSEGLKNYLISLGFKIIKGFHHWRGLSPLTDFIFREGRFPKEIAPLSVLIAQK